MSTVVVQQPQHKPRSQMSPWSTGLCDCGKDINSCCYAFWCCPCFACSTTRDFGESTCLPLLDVFGPGLLAASGIAVCVPPVTLGMRVAIRYRYEIAGSICDDIVVSCCCVCCSWCQMNREIKEQSKPTYAMVTSPTIPTASSTFTTTTTQVVSSQQQIGVMGIAPAPTQAFIGTK